MKHTLTLLTALLLAPLVAPHAADVQKPNIVFIFADDWGWGDLSCHGHPYLKTPNLDRLASEGVDFHQFNVLSPVCSPSRVAAMTGNFPARYSIREALSMPAVNRDKQQCDWLDPKVVTTARLLKQAGYVTGHFGKWHLGRGDAPPTAAYGFDESWTWGGPGHEQEARDFHGVFDKTIGFIRAHKDRPFYVNLWTHETHAPQVPTEESLMQYAHLDEQRRPCAAAVADVAKLTGMALDWKATLPKQPDPACVSKGDSGKPKDKYKSKEEKKSAAGKRDSENSTHDSVEILDRSSTR